MADVIREPDASGLCDLGGGDSVGELPLFRRSRLLEMLFCFLGLEILIPWDVEEDEEPVDVDG